MAIPKQISNRPRIEQIDSQIDLCGCDARAKVLGMWHDKLVREFDSVRRAAPKLFREWKRKAPAEVSSTKSTEQSLANRLNRLQRENGDPTGWWSKRPHLRQALADLLELQVYDIFTFSSPSDELGFPEFPGLMPLGSDETPVRTSRFGSLYDQTLAILTSPTPHSWIVVPPGGGKSLTVKLINARHGDQVTARTIRTLDGALECAADGDNRPLVLEVEERDVHADSRALTLIEGHRPGVTVLAAFPKPKSAQSGARWKAVEHVVTGPWIDRMLDWIDQRLDASSRDTKFDKEEVLSFIRREPILARKLKTPGELLALCACFDLYGRNGTLEVQAKRWVREFVARTLPADTPSTWRNHGASRCFASMSERGLLEQRLDRDERTFLDWTELVPRGDVPEGRAGAPGAAMAIAYLRDGQLIRASDSGSVMYPQWVSEAIAVQAIRVRFDAQDVAEWGALAADESRQAAVDDALDGLSPARLRQLAERVIEVMSGAHERSLAQVGALEALVAAFARRLSASQAKADDASIARTLMLLQLEHLMPMNGIGNRRPTTRRDRDSWLLAGWVISLESAPQATPVAEDLYWILPGWVPELQFAALCGLDFPWSTLDPKQASAEVRKLVSLAPRLLDRLAPQPVPDDVPRLLLPSLFMAGNWGLALEHLKMLAGSWEEEYLAESARRLAEQSQTDLVLRLWGLVGSTSAGSRSPIATRLQYLQMHHKPLLEFVVDNLPETVIVETAREHGTHRGHKIEGNSFHPGEPAYLNLLSREGRAAAVRGRLSADARPKITFDEARELVSVLDSEDLDTVVELVRSADGDLAAEFAVRVWSLLPPRAVEEARRTLQAGLSAAEGWFYSAPREHLGPLVEMLRETRPRPDWVQTWARKRLVEAGPYAEDLFRWAKE